MQWLSILTGKILTFMANIKTWLLVAALIITVGYSAYLKLENSNLFSQVREEQKNYASLVTDKANLTNSNKQLTQNLQSANQSLLSLQAQIKKERRIAAARAAALMNNSEQLQRELSKLERAAANNETDFEKCLNVVVLDNY